MLTPDTPLPTVLLTGFEPFGGESENASFRAVQRLTDRVIAGHRVVTAELPTVFGASLDRLRALIDEHRPALVLCTGEAGGSAAIAVERLAVNLIDARIPDNAGAQPVDQPVCPEAPTAYFTRLPAKAIVRRLGEAGIPATVSSSAGTFVCNFVFFGLMHAFASQPAAPRGGFIHVPYLPEQAARHPGAPALPVEVTAQALELSIAVALESDR